MSARHLRGTTAATLNHNETGLLGLPAGHSEALLLDRPVGGNHSEALLLEHPVGGNHSGGHAFGRPFLRSTNGSRVLRLIERMDAMDVRGALSSGGPSCS
jgi:hypothetical protein